jgi:hypothetical protein
MRPSSIAAVNALPQEEKEEIYCRFIPPELYRPFNLEPCFLDEQGRSLLSLQCDAGTADVIMDLRDQYEAQDPLLFAHLTDTINGQIHVLLYIVNDPRSERYDIDRMPDGSPTKFGVFQRNIPAEIEAMQAGLAPGQIRRGLRILKHSIKAFDNFVISLGHQMYFVEPLFYHNAITFERYGLAYQKGQKLMTEIHAGFQPGSNLNQRLDASTPFRERWMHNSIRGRSWAIHDGILNEPFTDITMYSRVGEHAGVLSFPDAVW